MLSLEIVGKQLATRCSNRANVWHTFHWKFPVHFFFVGYYFFFLFFSFVLVVAILVNKVPLVPTLVVVKDGQLVVLLKVAPRCVSFNFLASVGS